MEVRRVGQYRAVAYPDKEAVQRDGSILKAVPARWKKNTIVCAALAATVSLLASCQAEASPGAKAHLPTAIVTPEIIPSPTPAPTPAPTPKVIQAVPIFEHGVGRGAFGCVSVNPPVFFSEGEARDFIREIAEENELRFSEDAILENVDLPVKDAKPFKPGKTLELQTIKGELLLDGFDRDKRIAFEYVSTADLDSWGAKSSSVTIESYPLIDASRKLAEGLGQMDKEMTVVVFYDPVIHSSQVKAMMDHNNEYSSFQQEARKMAKENLRQQVRDFIEWLKAQGIV